MHIPFFQESIKFTPLLMCVVYPSTTCMSNEFIDSLASKIKKLCNMDSSKHLKYRVEHLRLRYGYEICVYIFSWTFTWQTDQIQIYHQLCIELLIEYEMFQGRLKLHKYMNVMACPGVSEVEIDESNF